MNEENEELGNELFDSREREKINQGLWTDEENLQYIIFLQKYRNKFACKLKKRKIRLFEQMSKFIRTRSTVQCRTHHQKYENKLGNTKAIIETYKQEIGIEKFKKIVKEIHKNKCMEKNQTTYLKLEFQQPHLQQEKRIEIGIQTEEIDENSLQNPSHIFQLSSYNSYLIPVFFYTQNLPY